MDKLNQEKAQAVIDFINALAGEVENGGVSKCPTLAEINSLARSFVQDKYGARVHIDMIF